MILHIKEYMDKYELTQTYVAKKINASYPTISKLYNGTATSITFENLEKLCNLLGCTPSDLIEINRNEDFLSDNIKEYNNIKYADLRYKIYKNELGDKIAVPYYILPDDNESTIKDDK